MAEFLKSHKISQTRSKRKLRCKTDFRILSLCLDLMLLFGLQRIRRKPENMHFSILNKTALKKKYGKLQKAYLHPNQTAPSAAFSGTLDLKCE